MLVDDTKTQSRLRTEKLDEKVAKLHIPRSAVHCTLKPDTRSDRVTHSRTCRTLNRWRPFVILAVSTMQDLRSAGVTRHKKSTVCAHQMAVPGQRRTGNPR